MTASQEFEFYCNGFKPLLNSLENERVRLVPFEPEYDTDEFFELATAHPSILDSPLFSPPTGFTSRFIDARVKIQEGAIQYIVVDKSDLACLGKNEEMIAGYLGFLESNHHHPTSAEFSIITLPSYDSTDVASHAASLLLSHCSASSTWAGGQEVKCLEWHMNEEDRTALVAAKKLGFRLSSILRWDQAVTPRQVPNRNLAAADGVLRRKPAPRRPAVAGWNTLVFTLG